LTRTCILRVADDIDGSADAATVHFSYGGVDYAIDLSVQNSSAFDAVLAPYIAAATEVGMSRGRRPAAVAGGSTKTGRRAQIEAIRAWAAERGLDLPARGGISKAVYDAYSADQQTPSGGGGLTTPGDPTT
jgi:hypothetical protein